MKPQLESTPSWMVNLLAVLAALSFVGVFTFLAFEPFRLFFEVQEKSPLETALVEASLFCRRYLIFLPLLYIAVVAMPFSRLFKQARFAAHGRWAGIFLLGVNVAVLLVSVILTYALAFGT